MQDLRFAGLFFLDSVVSEGKDLLQHFICWFFSSKCLEWFDDVLNDLVEGPEPLAEDHSHVDVLEVEHSDGHVGAGDADQQDDVPLDVLEHEDHACHLGAQQNQLHNHPVQGLPLDLAETNIHTGRPFM